MAKAFEATVCDRILVRAFEREHLSPPFVDLRIGKWGELELTLPLDPGQARALADALRAAADASCRAPS